MTNKEWLDYLANNSPGELAAWFAAEHDEANPIKEFVGLMQRITELTAERDELAAELDSARRDRETYRELLGKAIDFAYAITLLVDEGAA